MSLRSVGAFVPSLRLSPSLRFFVCLCVSLPVFVGLCVSLRVFVCLSASFWVFARLCVSLRGLGVFVVLR